MLNQQGGRIVWGIDSRGEPRGISNAEDKAAELRTLLMTRIVLRPLLSVATEAFAGKTFVLVEIPPGADKPYAFDRKVWVRLGTKTWQATDDATAQMIGQGATRESRWGRQPMPGFDLEDCDETELSEAQREIVGTSRFGAGIPEGAAALLRALYLYNSEQLTNAAMVLFARDPLEWAPNLALRVIAYSSQKQGKALHEQTVQGPAVRVLRQAIAIIQQQTGFTGIFSPGGLAREDQPAYALDALREGLVNAIAHRDYNAPGGQLRVEIFPDRLLIQNPGSLPDGWTGRDMLSREESHPTNPDIARVLYLRGLMERLGIGGRRLAAACRALKARPPVWKSADGVVSLTLFRAPLPPVDAVLLPRERDFLRTLKPGTIFKAESYAANADLSLRQARRDLTHLETLGILTRTGRGSQTLYTAAHKPTPRPQKKTTLQKKSGQVRPSPAKPKR
jgi:ATP-dependent DNA helicase RecG